MHPITLKKTLEEMLEIFNDVECCFRFLNDQQSKIFFLRKTTQIKISLVNKKPSGILLYEKYSEEKIKSSINGRNGIGLLIDTKKLIYVGFHGNK